MTGLSKLDRQLTADARQEIYMMFDAGKTVQEVYEHLTGLDIDTSRSGVGRYRIRLLKAMRSEMALERAAQHTIQDLANAPEQKHTRKLSQLIHAGLLQAVMALEDTEDFDVAERIEAVSDAAKALSSLARAEKDSAETNMKIQEFAEKQAAKAACTIDVSGNTGVLEVSFIEPSQKKGKAKQGKKKAKATVSRVKKAKA